ncbi:MAG: NADH-quinone oxidoreductase subunit C [Candidatus Zixiibacteriota bacterium]
MTREELKAYVTGHFDGMLKPLETGRYDPMFEVKPADLLAVARALRDDEHVRFDFLCNLGAVDTRERFEIVYSLASVSKNLRLDFKLIMPYEQAAVDSVQEIWPAANWYEREMWELYGIDIRNHENLKRFLLPDDWNQGHPMLKNWDAPDFVRLPEF